MNRITFLHVVCYYLINMMAISSLTVILTLTIHITLTPNTTLKQSGKSDYQCHRSHSKLTDDLVDI